MSANPLIRAEQSLGLQPSDQDWGLINANGDRLQEFVEYYIRNMPRGRSTTQANAFIYDFSELILESLILRLEARLPIGEQLQEWLRMFWSTVVDHHAGTLLQLRLQASDENCVEAKASALLGLH